MIARIVWWSEYKTSGICSVTDEHGVVQSYFLLASKIVQRPQRIQPGDYAKFSKIIPAARQGLLPLAADVVISPPTDTQTVVRTTISDVENTAGADALKAGV